MKHKLKMVAMMVLFITAAITGGCQKDDEITAGQTAEGAIQVTTISFDEFKADIKAYTELQNAVRAGREKSGVMHRDGFFYNTDDVTMISYTGYKTYTFPIYREDDKGIALENLVIRISTAGATDSYIFQYDFTPGEIHDVYTGKPIINLSNKTWVTKTNGGDEDSIIYKDSAGNCYVYAGDYYQDADNLVWFEVQGVPLRFERIECPEGHNDFTLIQDGQSNGGSDSSGSGNTGNPGGSGLGSININVVIPVIPDYNPIQNPSGPSGGSWGNHPNRPVITRPAVNLFYKLFFDELTKQERIVLMFNPELGDGLSDFIAGPLEGWPDRKDLAKEIFDFAMESQANRHLAVLLLDYLNNENVDMDTIEDAIDKIKNNEIPDNIINIIDKPCQSDIVTDVNNVCADLNDAFLNIFSGSDTHTVTYKGSSSMTAAANTQLVNTTTQTNGDKTYDIEIKISNDYMNTATDLSMATVVIHENIHAILLYLKHNQEIICIDENPTYSKLLDAYFSHLIDLGNVPAIEESNNAHHNFMTQFVGDIADTLKTYGISKGFNLSDDYYNAMAWQGLMDTSAFQEKYPQFDSNGNENPEFTYIAATIQSERYNSTLEDNNGNLIVDQSGNTISPKGNPCP